MKSEELLYIRLRGRVQGPFTADELHAFAHRGRFSRHHEVSHDRVDWESASKHPWLFPAPGVIKQRKAADNSSDKEPVEASPEEPDFRLAAEPVSLDKEQWYYARDQQEFGPFTKAQLRQLVSTGRLNYDDQFWTDGMQNWVRAESIPELFPELANDRREEPPLEDEERNPKARRLSGSTQRLSSMAVASFVLGLLGGSLLFFIGSILAIVFGHIALNQIRQSECELGGKGLAIAGLILGYIVVISSVVVGIVVMCMVMLRDSLV